MPCPFGTSCTSLDFLLIFILTRLLPHLAPRQSKDDLAPSTVSPAVEKATAAPTLGNNGDQSAAPEEADEESSLFITALVSESTPLPEAADERSALMKKLSLSHNMRGLGSCTNSNPHAGKQFSFRKRQSDREARYENMLRRERNTTFDFARESLPIEMLSHSMPVRPSGDFDFHAYMAMGPARVPKIQTAEDFRAQMVSPRVARKRGRGKGGFPGGSTSDVLAATTASLLSTSSQSALPVVPRKPGSAPNRQNSRKGGGPLQARLGSRSVAPGSPKSLRRTLTVIPAERG